MDTLTAITLGLCLIPIVETLIDLIFTNWVKVYKEDKEWYASINKLLEEG